MPGTYTRCPRCGPSRNGASVKQCKNCSTTFCSECQLNSSTATCPYCRSNNNRTIGYIKSGSSASSSGCFITTATLQNLNISDDNCYELRTFREFRDSFIQTNYPDLIEEYYLVAPIIVEKLEKTDTKTQQYKFIWDNYLKKCLLLIEAKDHTKATKLYKKMVLNLKKEFKIN